MKITTATATVNVVYPQTTAGISRNLWLDLMPSTPEPPGPEASSIEAFANGGGNLNGTAALILHGQAGTGADRVSVPRRAGGFSGNYCGVI